MCRAIIIKKCAPVLPRWSKTWDAKLQAVDAMTLSLVYWEIERTHTMQGKI